MMNDTGWSIVEFRGREGLHDLEDDWRRLYESMPQRTVFHAFDAHVAYVDHLMEDPIQARYLALTDGVRVRAICPLEARAERALGLPVRIWGTPLHPHWPLSDVVCPEDEARRALLPCVVRHLRETAEGRQLLALGPLPVDSGLLTGLHRFATSTYCSHIAIQPYVFDCRRTLDELLDQTPRRFRKELRRYGRRLSTLADVRYETATSADDLDRAFDTFLAVEGSGWKGAAGTGTAVGLHPHLVAFYRSLTRDLGAGDGCEIRMLQAEGRCIAVEFCLLTGDEYVALKIGYDEAYSRVSPGQLLHLRTLQRCCEDPRVKRYNQLSDATWLRVWGAGSVPFAQIHVGLGWRSRPLIAGLKSRFGWARRLVRRVRGSGSRR